ncbi:MAG: DUF1134 domain-containing protein [Pseudomonadota bacterium]|nr:DUF1134 domain-containing protein [Pseudomonadota bacterium]
MSISAFLKLCAAAAVSMAVPVAAQVQTIDPNAATEPAAEAQEAAPPAQEEYQPVEAGSQEAAPSPGFEAQSQAAPAAAAPSPSAKAAERASQAAGGTVAKGDVFKAAEGVFGRGAEGLAGLLEDLLRKQGEPSAYITGREAGGALVVGVRYGEGTLHHGVEGDRPVYWTGPSLGFDFGADANKVFVLVYNLHDSQNLYKRYPAAEGNAYVVGGFTASYMRRGDTVLIPIRLGVGARLGINAGYMRFSEKNRWLPF